MAGNKIKFYSNGFMIKALNTEYATRFKLPQAKFNYCGIEGDNWPIDKYSIGIGKDELSFIEDYLYEIVDNPDKYNEIVAVCNDMDFLNYYVECCNKANFQIDILYIETELEYPNCLINPLNNDQFEFLGYDYAYPGDDYYSSIYQEYKIINQYGSFNLNKNGLFNTEEEINEYITVRENLKKTSSYSHIEKGKFIIYKVWRYIGWFQNRINSGIMKFPIILNN